MSDQPKAEAPKIEFPCAHYPVKVVGMSGPEYLAFVERSLAELITGFKPEWLSARPSSSGSYCAYSFRFTAQSVAQLQEINRVLRSDARTKMVL